MLQGVSEQNAATVKSDVAASIREQLFFTSKALRNHSEQFIDGDKIKREVVVPFLRALGFNFDDFIEVIRDFPPDPNFRKRSVDFALLVDAKEVLLVNCTARRDPFRPVEARQMIWFLEHCTADIGIITNGIEYRCYSTWGEPRYEPFFEFRLDYTSSRLYEELVWFTKDEITSERSEQFVQQKRQARKIQQVLVDQYNEPSSEFVDVLKEQAGLTGDIDPEVVREAFFWLVNNSLNSALIMQMVRARQASDVASANGHAGHTDDARPSDANESGGESSVAAAS